MDDTYIWTEAFNCGPIARVMLESFHRHHNRVIHVHGTENDFKLLGDMRDHPNTKLFYYPPGQVQSFFKQGHKGTAYVFATVLSGFFIHNQYKRVIHVDSDLYFRKESIYLVENLLLVGYDIVGSRRCYKNNPSGVTGLDKYPDSISTYFMGLNLEKLPAEGNHNFSYLMDMCQGAVSYKGIPALDFFDPVTQAMLFHGARIFYLSNVWIGGQDEYGKKNTRYELNMHMDAGDNLIHFGGVGSGYAYDKKFSEPEKAYAEWAFWRWMLFYDIFINQDTLSAPDSKYPTVYQDGRWVSGSYDEHIYNLVKNML